MEMGLNGMAKKRKPPDGGAMFEDLAGRAPNTLLLNIQEDMQRLSHSQTEISTGMRFLVLANEEAKQSRQKIHDKLNDLREGHADTKARVGILEVAAQQLREDVNRHEERYQQDLGRAGFIAKMGGLFTKTRLAIVGLLGITGWQFWPPHWPPSWWPK